MQADNEASLVTEHGPTSSPVLVLDEDVVTIGRNPTNTLILMDRGVSRYHATIYRRGGRYFLRDHGSTNGTRLDDDPHRIECETPLRDGQLISAGAVRLRFVSKGQPERHRRLMRPEWLAANDRAVVHVAESILREGFAELPLLADALYDAGCDDEELLAHCRHSESHTHRTRCWVLDLIVPPSAGTPPRPAVAGENTLAMPEG